MTPFDDLDSGNRPDPDATEPADPAGDPAAAPDGGDDLLAPSDADAPDDGDRGGLSTPAPPD